MAAAVYLFGGEKYHPLIRPSILTAFLGYLLFIVGLLVDLGRPWNMVHIMVDWQHHSPMFEVSWCVMCYTVVLFLEFAPNVMERFRWTSLMRVWREVTPLFVIALLTLFTFAMSHSLVWTVVAFLVLALFEVMARAGAIRRDPEVPTLLIMAGVVLSTLHQSSLGSVFLIAPDRLHPLWYTPVLPLVFYTSALAVGPAMVIFEALTSARVFHRRPEMNLLSGVARALPWLLGINLALRFVDLTVRGRLGDPPHAGGAAAVRARRRPAQCPGSLLGVAARRSGAHPQSLERRLRQPPAQLGELRAGLEGGRHHGRHLLGRAARLRPLREKPADLRGGKGGTCDELSAWRGS
jgi:Ni/Fe-hydrogenase subunit HybB-like protein